MESTDKYIEFRKKGMQAFAKDNYRESVAMFTQFLEYAPDDPVILLSRGAAHMKLDKPDAAEVDFTRVVDNDPKNARAFHLRGLAREKRGDDENALVDLGRAIELSPAYGAAYLSRSQLLAKMGRDEQAVADKQMVIRLTSSNLEEFNNQNNVWHSHNMSVETDMETELNR